VSSTHQPLHEYHHVTIIRTISPRIYYEIMKGLGLATLPRWTCRQCVQSQRTTIRAPPLHPPSKKARGYSTRIKIKAKSSRTLSFKEGFALGRRVGRNTYFRATLLGLGLAGGAGYYWRDNIQYYGRAFQRAGRVAEALYLNINE